MDHLAKMNDKAGKTAGLCIGIDASRNRSGGARAHLFGILSELEPHEHGIAEVHVWAYAALLASLPDRPWLIKHAPEALEKALPHQLWWQATRLSAELEEQGCDILFTTDASTLSRFSPNVVLSQDLLSYEPSIMQLFGYGLARARLLAILYLQNRAFRHADGVIFLTRYTGELIQRSCGRLQNLAYVGHGVDERFKSLPMRKSEFGAAGSINCLYVSPVIEYKNHVPVVNAIALLRERGVNIHLTLIGGGEGRAKEMLDAAIEKVDPQGTFIHQLGAVAYKDLPDHLQKADLFLFASSCETFGITLLEGMSAGLPIACSNRSSLPETLKDGGLYFEPESPLSIAQTLEHLISDADLREKMCHRARELAKEYTWQRCSAETFGFIAATYAQLGKQQA